MKIKDLIKKLKPFGDSRDGGTVRAKPDPVKPPAVPTPPEKEADKT